MERLEDTFIIHLTREFAVSAHVTEPDHSLDAGGLSAANITGQYAIPGSSPDIVKQRVRLSRCQVSR